MTTNLGTWSKLSLTGVTDPEMRVSNPAVPTLLRPHNAGFATDQRTSVQDVVSYPVSRKSFRAPLARATDRFAGSVKGVARRPESGPGPRADVKRVELPTPAPLLRNGR